MDEYTGTTQQWLDARFRATDEHGVYRAHQPIYGFRHGPAEPGIVKRYTITHRILSALAQLDFGSLLDVGGAEGYKAALVRRVFGVDVATCDLSDEACARAREIYDIPARSIDIHRLPFDDASFDVVLCSETLEHVAEIEQATAELLRVARRAVVITVPREPKAVVERNIREKIPHAHIHALDLRSFDHLRAAGYTVLAEPMLDPRLRIPMVLADATPRESKGRASAIMRAFNLITPLLRAMFGPRSARALIRLDRSTANASSYTGMVFTILKDPRHRLEHSTRSIDPQVVIDFVVPLHRLPVDSAVQAQTLHAAQSLAASESGGIGVCSATREHS